MESLTNQVEWKPVNGELKPFIDGQEVAWAAQPGSQVAFLNCPIFEALLEGTRGGGKTDTLLMDFAQHVGKGFGAEWRGILFRQSYPQLSDVIAKTKKWFPRVFPRAKYNESASKWVFPEGEELLLRHMATPDDYWCVPHGEVCTRSGWKQIQDVHVGEEVLSCTSSGENCWAVVDRVNSTPFSGLLVEHVGRGVHMQFTENHRLPVLESDGSHALVEYREAPAVFKVRRAGTSWTGAPHPTNPTVPFVPPEQTGGPPDKSNRRICSRDMIEFLGWFLSEGNTCKLKSGGRNHSCAVSQSLHANPAEYAQIEALLTRMGINFKKDDKGFTWVSKSWSHWLRHFGRSHEKFVPAEIRNAEHADLKLFFDTYMLGDGATRGDSYQVGTVSPQMRDDLTEIGIKLGYKVTCSEREPTGPLSKRLMHFLTFTPDRGTSQLHKRHCRRVQHDGLVHCLSVRGTESFYVRQEGCVWLSGNSYHGHAYPWIAFEELTSWPDDKCYKVMMSCSRSTKAGMPRKYRATTNPYGPGHNWVKRRFKLPVPPRHIVGRIVDDPAPEGEKLPPRVAIHSSLSENKVMLATEPHYVSKLRAAARNPAELRAWLHGDWDIVAGGMFDDVWMPSWHVVPDLRHDMIPRGWRIDRSYDHGQSRPFSVGWWAQSNGEPIRVGRHVLGTIRGDVYRIAEWYGWCNVPNEGMRMTAAEIAKGIIEREERLGLRGRVKAGPADTSVFDDYEPGKSVAGDMARQGVYWLRADKTSGSRKQGWQQMRQLLRDAVPPVGADGEISGPRERPGLFICESCDQFLRTVPILPRDEKDLDDVDTDAEDHVADEARYRLRVKKAEATSHRWK